MSESRSPSFITTEIKGKGGKNNNKKTKQLNLITTDLHLERSSTTTTPSTSSSPLYSSPEPGSINILSSSSSSSRVKSSSSSSSTLPPSPIPTKYSSNESIEIKRIKRSPVQKIVSLFKKKKRGTTIPNMVKDEEDVLPKSSEESSPTTTLNTKGNTNGNVVKNKNNIKPSFLKKQQLSESKTTITNKIKLDKKSMSTSGISTMGDDDDDDVSNEKSTQSDVGNGNGSKKSVRIVAGSSTSTGTGTDGDKGWSSGSSSSSIEDIKIPGLTQLENEIKNLSISKKNYKRNKNMISDSYEKINHLGIPQGKILNQQQQEMINSEAIKLKNEIDDDSEKNLIITTNTTSNTPPGIPDDKNINTTVSSSEIIDCENGTKIITTTTKTILYEMDSIGNEGFEKSELIEINPIIIDHNELKQIETNNIIPISNNVSSTTIQMDDNITELDSDNKKVQIVEPGGSILNNSKVSIIQEKIKQSEASLLSRQPKHYNNRPSLSRFRISQFDGNSIKPIEKICVNENNKSSLYSTRMYNTRIDKIIPEIDTDKNLEIINLSKYDSEQQVQDDDVVISNVKTSPQASKHEKYKAVDTNIISKDKWVPTQLKRSSDGDGSDEDSQGMKRYISNTTTTGRSLTPSLQTTRTTHSLPPDINYRRSVSVGFTDLSPRSLSPNISPSSNIKEVTRKVFRHSSLDEEYFNEQTRRNDPGRFKDSNYTEAKWNFMKTDLEEKNLQSNPQIQKTHDSFTKVKYNPRGIGNSSFDRESNYRTSIKLDVTSDRISPIPKRNEKNPFSFLEDKEIKTGESRNVTLKSILKPSVVNVPSEQNIESNTTCQTLSASVNIKPKKNPSILKNLILSDKTGESGDGNDEFKITYYVKSNTESPINSERSTTPTQLKSFANRNNTTSKLPTSQIDGTTNDHTDQQLIEKFTNVSQGQNKCSNKNSNVNENKLLTINDVSNLIKPSEESIKESVRQLKSLLSEIPPLSSPKLVRTPSPSQKISFYSSENSNDVICKDDNDSQDGSQFETETITILKRTTRRKYLTAATTTNEDDKSMMNENNTTINELSEQEQCSSSTYPDFGHIISKNIDMDSPEEIKRTVQVVQVDIHHGDNTNTNTTNDIILTEETIIPNLENNISIIKNQNENFIEQTETIVDILKQNNSNINSNIQVTTDKKIIEDTKDEKDNNEIIIDSTINLTPMRTLEESELVISTESHESDNVTIGQDYDLARRRQSCESFTDSFKHLQPFNFNLGAIHEGKRERLYKVLVVGELGTGKTSIIKRYVHQFFSQHYRATIGVDFALKVLRWDPETVVRLQLWDIAGQERFGSMTRVYYKEAVGAFVVFDVTRSGTLDAVPKWKADLDAKVVLPDGRPIPTVLLANKSDQPKEGMAANREKMNEFSKQHGFAAWYETSAKENVHIDDSASFLVSKILDMDRWSQEPMASASSKLELNMNGKHKFIGNSENCSC